MLPPHFMDTIDTNKTAFANENITRMDLESDIRLASRMLSGSSINELRLCVQTQATLI